MDCIDCHNRAAHTFVTAEEPSTAPWPRGAISPDAALGSQGGPGTAEGQLRQPGRGRRRFPAQLQAFYRSSIPRCWPPRPRLVKAAGEELVTLYSQNVFPFMKVTWGTHPNHIGHMSYPGCFRCHDGDHAAKTAPASRRIAPPATTCWPSKKPSPRCSPTSAFNSGNSWQSPRNRSVISRATPFGRSSRNPARSLEENDSRCSCVRRPLPPFLWHAAVTKCCWIFHSLWTSSKQRAKSSRKSRLILSSSGPASRPVNSALLRGRKETSETTAHIVISIRCLRVCQNTKSRMTKAMRDPTLAGSGQASIKASSGWMR
jgi:hypothetical protein